MASKHSIAFAALLASIAWSGRARATDPQTVTWSDDWPRVHLLEALVAVTLTAGDTLFEDYVPLPSHASWNKPILFDSWARGVFRGRTAAVQSFASTSTDIMYKGGALVPFLVDDYFAAASVHQNADVALQLAIIDFQSFGIAGLVSLGAEHAVGRARPYTLSCDASGKVVDAQGHVMQTCGTSNDFRSFYSGHATATATSAGLVCVHHQHLSLFGGGFADLAPCLFMIGVSAATGVLRLVYDEHWASDVIVGWADGVLSGYVLPSLLHFGFGSGRPIGQIRAGTLEMAPSLFARPGGTELGMVGIF
ncbi:MAG TPA: phosphatase PAP2 family protein [Polyangiaceae bacterium]